MDTRRVTYLATTGLFALALTASGVMYLSGADPIVEAVNGHLGYPLHFIPMLGIAKVLGAAALVIPGFTRLREWAYAGFTFNLIAAAWGHLAVGDGLGGAAPVIVLGAMLAASYATQSAGPLRAPTPALA